MESVNEMFGNAMVVMQSILPIIVMLIVPATFFQLLSPRSHWEREYARQKRQERKFEKVREKERARQVALEQAEREAQLEQQRRERVEQWDRSTAHPREPGTWVPPQEPVTRVRVNHRVRPQETYADVLSRIRDVQVKDLNAHMQQGPQSDYILHAPAVLDSSIPATAAYLEACGVALNYFHGVTDLDTVAPNHVVAAADFVEKRWDEAVDFARRNVHNPLTPSQRRRVVQLADMVAHGGRENPEAQLAHERLVEILSTITYSVPQVGGGIRKVALNPSSLLSTDHIDAIAALDGSTRKQLER